MAPDILAEASLVLGDFDAPLEPLVEQAGNWRIEDAQRLAHERKCNLRDILRDSIKDIDDFISR